MILFRDISFPLSQTELIHAVGTTTNSVNNWTKYGLLTPSGERRDKARNAYDKNDLLKAAFIHYLTAKQHYELPDVERALASTDWQTTHEELIFNELKINLKEKVSIPHIVRE